MALQISQAKSGSELANRLSEIEKIDVRDASEDRLEWLRLNSMSADNMSFDGMKEAQTIIRSSYTDKFKRSM